MKKGKEFEILIEALYKKIDNSSRIIRNDKIFGHDTKIEREIDLSIRNNIGAHEILMIVQARDYGVPLDINVIGEFSAVIKDVRANKGIIISAKGFTKQALVLAENYGIDALTAYDLNNPKWTLDLKMPVVMQTFSGSYNITFKMTANDAYVKLVENKNLFQKATEDARQNGYRFTIDNGKTLFTAEEDLRNHSVYGKLHYDGKEGKMVFNKENLKLFVTDGVLVPASELTIFYRLERKEYYKYFEVKEFKGLINNMTHEIKPGHFKIEGSEFTVEDYEVRNQKAFSLETWNVFTDDIELIHPYKIKLYTFGIERKSNSNIKFAGRDKKFNE